ncbi:MAG: hypothetical protein KF696_01195 [Planctomycetes bacterium]|nr:hypothetical protein [Planctomycetota bacterium]MCW8134445.1 hypothetical protein [Planctomycetota bacterium]
MKDKDTIASNNERYAEKLKSYANMQCWNETLRADIHNDIEALKERSYLELEPCYKFGREELEERRKPLSNLVGLIWA